MKSVIFLSLFLLGSCCKEPDENSIHILLGEIREKLPEGWSAEYEAKYDLIEVTRAGKVEVYTMLPNQAYGQEPDLDEFSFALRVGEEISKDDYRKTDLHNQEIREKLGALYDHMVARQISQKFDSFLPANDEERALVLRYENFKKEIKSLPDFSFKDLSLSWIYGSPDNEWKSVADDGIRASSGAVRLDVIRVLSKYGDQ